MIRVLAVVPIYGFHENLPILLEKLIYIKNNYKYIKVLLIINDGICIKNKIKNIDISNFEILDNKFNYNVYGYINYILKLYKDNEYIWFHDQDSYPLIPEQWIKYFTNKIYNDDDGVISPIKIDEFNNLNKSFYLKFINNVGLFDFTDYGDIYSTNIYGHAGNLVNKKIFPIHDKIISADDVGDLFYSIFSLMNGKKNYIISLFYHHPNLIIKNKMLTFKNKILYFPSNGIYKTNGLHKSPYVKLYNRLKIFLPKLYIKFVIKLKKFYD